MTEEKKTTNLTDDEILAAEQEKEKQSATESTSSGVSGKEAIETKTPEQLAQEEKESLIAERRKANEFAKSTRLELQQYRTKIAELEKRTAQPEPPEEWEKELAALDDSGLVDVPTLKKMFVNATVSQAKKIFKQIESQIPAYTSNIKREMNIAAAEEQYDGEDGNPTFAEIREMFQKTPMSDEEAQEIISAKNSAKKAYQIGLKKWKELNPENGETKPVNNGGIVRKPPTKITGTSGGGKTTLTDESLNNLIDSGKFKDMSKEERWKIMKEL